MTRHFASLIAADRIAMPAGAAQKDTGAAQKDTGGGVGMAGGGGGEGRGSSPKRLRPKLVPTDAWRDGYMSVMGSGICLYPVSDNTASSTITKHTSVSGTGFPEKSLTTTDGWISFPGENSSSSAFGVILTSRLYRSYLIFTPTSPRAYAGLMSSLAGGAPPVAASHCFVELIIAPTVTFGIHASSMLIWMVAESLPSLISKGIGGTFSPWHDTYTIPYAGERGERTMMSMTSPGVYSCLSGITVTFSTGGV
mmetsp:Transcript_11143/g.21913  ORF Transcript_11143/g.21913 Transcript_11143/m.21913 type:complete len:252 (-) Transcript_11143:867-1622(-)